MNWATAIIDASWRVRSAIPWESPAKPAAVRNDASRITSQPTAPPFVAPRRRPVSRISSACSVATIADSRMRPNTIAPRLRRRREEALEDAAVEILDHPHPGPRAGEERGHHATPGVR